jgi:hypothetical protein
MDTIRASEEPGDAARSAARDSRHSLEARMGTIRTPLRLLAVATATVLPLALHRVPPPRGDWPAYGGDAGGSRFSPLTQVRRANVAALRVAWTFHTGEARRGGMPHHAAFEATPLVWSHGDYRVVMRDGTELTWSRRYRARDERVFGGHAST